MIRCRAARRSIDAALERELALEQRFALDEHVAACAACAEHERRARRLQELLEGPGAAAVPDLEAAARAVFAALESGAGGAWRPPASRLARLGAWTAAAAAVALVTLVLVLARRDEAPAPARPVPRVPAAVVELAAASEAPARDPTPPWSAAAVEVTVRAALLECFSTPGADEQRAQARFLDETREPARAGWPVRRFVEGALECPDTDVALAAARCLGVMGDASAATALERVLGRADLAEGALDALGALGEPAVATLERALAEPALAPRALLQLCRVGGPRAAGVLERAARAAHDDTSPSREALLDALTATGPAAVASLLRLAGERAGERGESDAILARLPLVRGAGPELVEFLARERIAGELAYRALFFLQPPEALPWLEERCATSRERAAALETMAAFEGEAPLAAALRLALGGRVPRDDVRALLVGLFERDAERAARFTHELTGGGPGLALETWLALLIESEHPAAARALVPLVFHRALAADDQRWAALAVGELGGAEEAESLLDELGAHAGQDRRRTAACLLSIHAHLGEDGVRRLLAPCSESARRRVLAALEDGGRAGDSVLVHRVARALEGALTELEAADQDSPHRKEPL